MFPKADIHPIVFDEIYILDKKNENYTVIFSNFFFIYKNKKDVKKTKKTLDNKNAPNRYEINFFFNSKIYKLKHFFLSFY